MILIVLDIMLVLLICAAVCAGIMAIGGTLLVIVTAYKVLA